MIDRLVVLGIAGAVGMLLLAGYTVVRRRGGPAPERLDVTDLGLELMAGCCAFVVFTSPSCRPCKATLALVDRTAAGSNGLTEVATVDAVERADLAIRYDVRTLPTTFLITASGHVLRRWRDVPDPGDLASALEVV